MSEMRLIDANALESSLFQRTQNIAKEHLNGALEKPYAYLDCAMSKALIDWLEKAPTIDAVPVVHGRWVKAHGMMPPEYHHRKQCSMCGGWALQDYFGRERMSHYCPNCGAKMDAEEG